MKKMLAIVAVLGLCTAVNAQPMLMTAEQATGELTYMGERTQDPYAYLENTNSLYYLPQRLNDGRSFADDIHNLGCCNNPDAPDYGYFTMTGFDLAYVVSSVMHSETEAGELSMVVRFWENDPNCNVIAGPLASYHITGLATGGYYREWDISADPVMVPCGNLWFEVTFYKENLDPENPLDTHTNVAAGMYIAYDYYPEVGSRSHDWYMVFGSHAKYGPGPILGLGWIGGYSPPPYWNPAGNFILSVRGTPEPISLALLALGGLVAVRRRR